MTYLFTRSLFIIGAVSGSAFSIASSNFAKEARYIEPKPNTFRTNYPGSSFYIAVVTHEIEIVNTLRSRKYIGPVIPANRSFIVIRPNNRAGV